MFWYAFLLAQQKKKIDIVLADMSIVFMVSFYSNWTTFSILECFNLAAERVSLRTARELNTKSKSC